VFKQGHGRPDLDVRVLGRHIVMKALNGIRAGLDQSRDKPVNDLPASGPVCGLDWATLEPFLECRVGDAKLLGGLLVRFLRQEGGDNFVQTLSPVVLGVRGIDGGSCFFGGVHAHYRANCPGQSQYGLTLTFYPAITISHDHTTHLQP